MWSVPAGSPPALQMFCSWMLPPSCAWAACVGTQQLCHRCRCAVPAPRFGMLWGQVAVQERVPVTPRLLSPGKVSLKQSRAPWQEGLLPPTVTVPLSPASRDAPTAAGASSPAPGLWQELGRQCRMTACHHPLRHCHLTVTAPAQPPRKGMWLPLPRSVGEGGEPRSPGPEGTLWWQGNPWSVPGSATGSWDSAWGHRVLTQVTNRSQLFALAPESRQ